MMRALLVYPTHENCDEVATDAEKAGLDAAVYPARSTDAANGANCWNADADEAERIGFSVVKTICPSCPQRKRCGESGYLKQLGRVKDATIAACTHKRAEYTGLQELSQNRPYVSIHENAVSILRPRCECSSADLVLIQTLFQDLLNNPNNLDWFGDDSCLDSEGAHYHSAELARRKQRLYAFCVHLAEIVDHLRVSVQAAETITEWQPLATSASPQGIERLLFHASKRQQIRFEKQPWRFIFAAATGELKSAAVVVYHPPQKRCRTNHSGLIPVVIKKLIGFRHNPPAAACITWFNDATISADLLSSVLNYNVNDRTPHGRIQLQKKAVQIPRDITRQTAIKVVMSILRGVLVDRKHFQRIGLIGHSTHTNSFKSLEPEFSRRIVRITYFGSGEERSSNAWHRECDLIVIAGTPRVPPNAIRDYLIQIGRVGAAAREAAWGPIRWIGTTESGENITVQGRGYHDDDWRQAQRDLVRASLVQAIGRGRGILEHGCEVLVLSNEECGVPISDACHQPLNDSHTKVLNNLVNLSAVFSNNSIIGKTAVSSSKLASALSLSNRQIRDILKNLDERGLVLRVGERGGWLPIDRDPPIDGAPSPPARSHSHAE